MFCCLCRRSRKEILQEQKQPEPTQKPADKEPVRAPSTKQLEPTRQWLLPPQRPEHKGRKTLVLDLDETLIHSSFQPVPSPDYIITIELEGVHYKVYVQKRPGVDEFLEAVASKFEVIIFTASLDKYANPVLDILDPKGFCTSRLFRESCVQHYGNYVKDLSLLGRDLRHCLIVDNSPFAYIFQTDHAVPISSWFHDRSDRELYDLVPFLNTTVANTEDVVQALQTLHRPVQQDVADMGDLGASEQVEEDEEDMPAFSVAIGGDDA